MCWSPARASSGASARAAPRRPRHPLLQPPAPTVRVVRADYFTTKGQGFLYVEARTTRDTGQTQAPITMRLENDSGAGTAFASPRNMTRFVDSGEYMFHRNLFKVSQRPNQIRVTGLAGTTVDGQTTGTVSDWLRDVTPLTANPNYKWNYVDDYKHPQQLYARFEEIAQQYPDIAEIVDAAEQDERLPAQGAWRPSARRTGTAAQAAVVVSSAAWGHEGGNGITVEMVNRPGSDLPLAVEVNGRAVRVLLAKNASGRARQHRDPGLGRDRGRRVAGPDRPRAPVPHQRGHRDRAGDDDAGRADRLPGPEARRRAGRRGPARPVHDPRAADRQVPRRVQARRDDPGHGSRARVGADHDHARDRRAARAQLRGSTRRPRTSSRTPTSS